MDIEARALPSIPSSPSLVWNNRGEKKKKRNEAHLEFCCGAGWKQVHGIMETYPRKYSPHDARQLCFNEALTNFLICDSIPPSVLDGDGFQRLIEEIDPKLTVPRSDMKRKLVGIEFEVKQKTEALLQEARERALSVAIVQKNLQGRVESQEMVSLRIQFIDQGFRLRSIMMRPVPRASFDFNEEISYLELPDHCLAFGGGDPLEPKWLVPNFRDMFEEVLRIVLAQKSLSGVLGKGRDLIKHLLLKNKVYAHILVQCQKVGIACPTFANISDQNDSLLIFKTTLLLEGPLKSLEMYEEVHPLVPNHQEWTYLRRLSTISKEMSNLLVSWDGVAGIHRVIPELYDFSAKLQREMGSQRHIEVGTTELVQSFLDTLNCLLPKDGCSVPVLGIANFLDPRFHGVHLEHHGTMEAVKGCLEEECSRLPSCPAMSSLPSPSGSPSSPSELLVKKMKKDPEETSLSLNSEFDRYMALPVAKSSEGDILKFWRQNEIILPNLARMARKFLVAPAVQPSMPHSDHGINSATMAFIKHNFHFMST